MSKIEIPIEVSHDHIERMAKVAPFRAICELIWNAYDADASNVSINITKGVLTLIDKIEIIDDGLGLSFQDAKTVFQTIGNSWKQKKYKTDAGRCIHGEKGEGRFSAFALGESVNWLFSNSKEEFIVSGNSHSLESFILSSPLPSSKRGCTVTVTNIPTDYKISFDDISDKIRDHFALKLYHDPSFVIIYDGQLIDVKNVINCSSSCDINFLSKENEEIKAVVEIIEWNIPVKKTLFFCDGNGVVYNEEAAGVQARGFNYTAYLSSNFLTVYSNVKAQGLEDFDSDYKKLLSEVKSKIREYFKTRAIEEVKSTIESWKESGIYPYVEDSEDFVEEASKQLFNVVASQFVEYSSDFAETPISQQKVIFQLLRSSIESKDSDLLFVINKLINLPKDKQEELADLLKKTNISNIITSTKSVIDRLDFLKALQELLFNKDSKKELKERSQLHKIIANQTWIFGEEYNLTNNDEDLTSVLFKHLQEIKQAEDFELLNKPVRDSENKKAIIDLMLARRIPLPKGEQRKHLVIELKRPSQPINADGIQQIKKYANAVIDDERFHLTDVEWEFIIVSNNITDEAKRDANQAGRPQGIIAEFDKPKVRVWIKTWGQIIAEAEGRLNFYKEKLGYEATSDSALDFFSKLDPKYLDKHTLKRIEDKKKQHS